MRVPLLPVFVLVLALTAQATARPLSERELHYATAVESLLGAPLLEREGLSSRSGAAGVRLRFADLTLVRLRFPSPAEAEAYAARPELARQAQRRVQRVEVRQDEVVLAGGAFLAEPAQARLVLSYAWGASLDPPSAVQLPSAKRARGGAIPLRPRRPASVASAQAPSATALEGSYLTRGAGRVTISAVKVEPDGARCLVRVSGVLHQPDREFEARYDGRVLTLILRESPQGPPRIERYIWRPGPQGAATFVRTGVSAGLLPDGFERFWHPQAE